MSSDSISEATFLLTELRYTLGQLHVQVLDLDPDERAQERDGQSVDSILEQMAEHEANYQTRIHGLLGQGVGAAPDTSDAIPLPVSNADTNAGTESQFEHLRAGTIATIETLGDAWPAGLVELIREQVQQDRRFTTQLATLRMALYNVDLRPDLNQPLTQDPEPHKLEHS